MLGASLYILVCSARNRFRARLRRLKQPRYLAGAVAAAAYFYFTIFARRGPRGTRPGQRGRGGPAEAASLVSLLAAAGPALAAVPLVVVAALTWLLPFSSGLLEFSQAEVQFLFPAPLSHRQLIAHRLVRSQLGLLVAACVAAAFSPQGDIPTRVVRALAIWVLLVSARLYFTGVVMARRRFRDGRLFAKLLTRAPAGGVCIVLGQLGDRAWRAYTAAPVAGVTDGLTRLVDVVRSAETARLLLPFSALTRPLFAASWRQALMAIPGSLVVLAALTAWVLALVEPFEDSAPDGSGGASAVRGSMPTRVGKSTLATWRLAPTGRPETAFVWKAVQQTFRVVDRMMVIRMIVLACSMGAIAMASGTHRGTASIVGMFATVGAAICVALGPQMLRTDLRQDLAHMELLKTWPVGGAAIVRGEMIWPTAQLTVLSWAAMAIAWYLSGSAFPVMSQVDRVSYAAAAALLAPSLIGTQFAVHNATAIAFPAWVPVGNQRARGLDMMGQRLILLGATTLAVLIVCLPGVAVGAILWFAFRRWMGTLVLVPAAAVASVIIGLELLLVTEMLGPLFERVDIVEVERNE